MHVGRALRHRNYRLFFVGQGISLIGTWITRVATSWLVYRLTGSAMLLGVVGFAGQIPTFLLAPFAGVAVDRWNRHRVLVWSQVLSMLQSVALAAFALTRITIWEVIVLVAIQGLVNAFDTPARQAFVVEMVESREDLPNAIALNSTIVNIARLVGPSIAGVLIALFGEGWCFAIDAASYVAVIASLLMMHVALKPRRPTRHPMHELREGFRYVGSHVAIRSALLLLAAVSLVGAPFMVLLPIFAKAVLHGGPHTLGVLTAASGVGAIAGALWLASRPDASGMDRVVTLAGIAFGTSLVAFGLANRIALSLVLMVTTGAGMMIVMAATNTLIQTLVEEDKRGRVMSFFTMAFFGMTPFGSLAAGALAERFGAPGTVTAGGVATLLAVAGFASVRPRRD